MTFSISHLKQLTDGNADGTVFGRTTSDPIAFYGGTPAVQRAGGNQVAVNQSAANGTVFNINTVTVSPSNVSSLSTAVVALTFTGSPTLSGDHVVLNKITNTQAGLGVAYARAASTAAVVQVNYVNVSAGTLTPTATESYLVASLRGIANSVTLSPSAIGSASAVEQQFTVAGLAPGMLVNVIPGVDQAGLAIGGFRVVSNNLLGVTFLNPTAATITPTASVSYSYINLNGLAPVGNTLTLGINIGTLNSTISTSIVEQNITVSGVLSNDVAMGPPMRTNFQSSGMPVSSRITAANVVAVGILNYSGTAGVTPTASEMWYQTINRANPLAPLQLYSVTLAPAAVGPNTAVEQGFTVTGLVASTVALVNKPSFTTGLAIIGYRVSAANTLAITFCNPTSATIAPPSETYLVGNFQNLAGVGNYVAAMASPAQNATINLANEVRATLASTGLFAGA